MTGKEKKLDWAGGAISLPWRPDKALPASESPLQKSHVGHKCLFSVLDGGYPEKSVTLAGKLKWTLRGQRLEAAGQPYPSFITTVEEDLSSTSCLSHTVNNF